MISNDGKSADWAERLIGQGIAPERVESARAAALELAQATRELLFDAETPIAPGDFTDLLLAAAKPKS